MKFIVVPNNESIPTEGRDTAYLHIDHWNDFAFVTMFSLVLFDENQKFYDIGNIKIGFKGQDADISTHKSLQTRFERLTPEYFSVGLDVDYYKNLTEVPSNTRKTLMLGLRDIAFDISIIESILEEPVFNTSLLRTVSFSAIKGQFKRVLEGGVPLTNYNFKFVSPAEERKAHVELEFKVISESIPSTNIHAVIGRNGVGKTTLLNGMTDAITKRGKTGFTFFELESWEDDAIADDYFSSLVSVSFSAFDPFSPPPEQSNPVLGTCYFYIGLKNIEKGDGVSLKTLPELNKELQKALSMCFSQEAKKNRWLDAIKMLESDDNFAEMNLGQLAELSGDGLRKKFASLIERMSAGHEIVLFTITKLVLTVEEKTLVLIDEPESHLHPPLLSAFIRALSQLLFNRNGVAIIATHSPVVLQEIPKSCVWKVIRSGLAMSCDRPETETFGENVGTLTREVFGLEVAKSGFLHLLTERVSKGGSYEEIFEEYERQLGYEAQSILRALVLDRDNGVHQ